MPKLSEMEMELLRLVFADYLDLTNNRLDWKLLNIYRKIEQLNNKEIENV
jgi:DNA-binding CsgD family transcriptional regulator